MSEQEDKSGCQKCSNPKASTDVCPYGVEIHDDHSLCYCCEECRDDCAMGI